MTWTSSSKGYLAVNAYPRTLSCILLSVGGLALFLILGSCILVPNPIGSTVRGYFYGIDGSLKLDFSGSSGNTTIKFPREDNVDNKNVSPTSNSQVPTSSSGPSLEETGGNFPSDSTSQASTSLSGSWVDDKIKETLKNLSHESDSLIPLSSSKPSTLLDGEEMKDLAAPVPVPSSNLSHRDWFSDGNSSSNVTDNDQNGNSVSVGFTNNSSILDAGTNNTIPASFGSKPGDVPDFSYDSPLPSNSSRTDAGSLSDFERLN